MKKRSTELPIKWISNPRVRWSLPKGWTVTASCGSSKNKEGWVQRPLPRLSLYSDPTS